jgi:hypothetical protein
MDGEPVRLVDPPKIDPPFDRPAAPVTPPTRVWASGGLSERWAPVLGLGWPVVWCVLPYIEPAPAHPQAALSTVEVVIFAGLLACLFATSILAGTRRRAAAPAAVITGLVSMAMVVSCPVSGHHHFGVWWLGELALVLAMLAVSVAGLRETARR